MALLVNLRCGTVAGSERVVTGNPVVVDRRDDVTEGGWQSKLPSRFPPAELGRPLRSDQPMPSKVF